MWRKPIDQQLQLPKNVYGMAETAWNYHAPQYIDKYYKQSGGAMRGSHLYSVN